MVKKVLIVDDSALVRRQLTEIIQTLNFEIDIAKNGKEAVEKATSTQYDVITMDINMPVMDGIEAVKKIMRIKPTAILMISSLTIQDAEITMKAMDAGAIDYITKPGTMNVGKAKNAQDIVELVKCLSSIPKRRLQRKVNKSVNRERKVVAQSVEQIGDSRDIQKVVLIGSSTGGPGLIEQICAGVPINYKYPICIVQHMPEKFTKVFSQRLNDSSVLDVHETTHDMELLPGNIYVARGGVHMNFAKKTSGKIVIREDKEKGDNFFQPSVNDMMSSALNIFDGENLIGVLLTGIGDDGADSMVKLKKAGAYTLGESEESATVYGMPRVAFEKGGVSEQLNFSDILKKIVTLK
ncbi:chemotaxis-specific protein-glutamate methyltransferase CheB [Sulfurimonas sp.]|uniref:chemotaxis-specific protein-glutamate methyltransferase CheB n=1 Tax=Sulfurimonas sp. TaxID=2022749 RepID=UPI002B48B176|nr:chemotaxis-specific protein-glutamate methyltransferase CheB [Sulfurimonas sp.]